METSVIHMENYPKYKITIEKIIWDSVHGCKVNELIEEIEVPDLEIEVVKRIKTKEYIFYENS